MLQLFFAKSYARYDLKGVAMFSKLLDLAGLAELQALDKPVRSKAISNSNTWFRLPNQSNNFMQTNGSESKLTKQIGSNIFEVFDN